MCQLPVITIKNPTPEFLAWLVELDSEDCYSGEYIPIGDPSPTL